MFKFNKKIKKNDETVTQFIDEEIDELTSRLMEEVVLAGELLNLASDEYWKQDRS